MFCHLCNSHNLIENNEFRNISSFVTSDAKAFFYDNVHLATCLDCSAIQKIYDKKFNENIEKIYKNYTLYHQSNGIEQLVFNENGEMQTRSEKLLSCFFSIFPEKIKSTAILDYGCGIGTTLQTIRKYVEPTTHLYGFDIKEHANSKIDSIPNAQFYSENFNRLKKKNDVIVSIHSLEHFFKPLLVLKEIHKKLKKNGLLLIHVPNLKENPFDLLVIDHWTHFTLESLVNLIQKADFEVVLSTTEWINKELTLVVKKRNKGAISQSVMQFDSSRFVSKTCVFFKRICLDIQQIDQSIGFFGASIVGIWVGSIFKKEITFFVDEDPYRTDKILMGKQVMHPKNISKTKPVYVPYPLFGKVSSRLRDYKLFTTHFQES